MGTNQRFVSPLRRPLVATTGGGDILDTINLPDRVNKLRAATIPGGVVSTLLVRCDHDHDGVERAPP